MSKFLDTFQFTDPPKFGTGCAANSPFSCRQVLLQGPWHPPPSALAVGSCIHYLVFIHHHCPLNIMKIHRKRREIQLIHRGQPMRTLGGGLVLSEVSSDYVTCNYCLKLEGWRLLVQLPLKWCSSLELLPGFMTNINVFCCLAINISKAPFPVVDRCALSLSRCLRVTLTSICCTNK